MTFRADQINSGASKSLPLEDGEHGLVLWAAGVATIVGLAAGGIASSHLTSSLSDYDAPGSAVVLAQHQIQRATGANPEEGYEVVVRTAAPIGARRPCRREWRRSWPFSGRARRSSSVLDYANTGDSTMISKDGDFTVVVATVGERAGEAGRHRPRAAPLRRNLRSRAIPGSGGRPSPTSRSPQCPLRTWAGPSSSRCRS